MHNNFLKKVIILVEIRYSGNSKVYIFCQIKNEFFSRMLKGNLFLYERVNIFELDERVFFPIVANCLNALFCLIDYFFILPALFYCYCEGRTFFYIADIVSRCAKIYPQWFAFSFVLKKNAYRQIEK